MRGRSSGKTAPPVPGPSTRVGGGAKNLQQSKMSTPAFGTPEWLAAKDYK